MNFIKDFKKLLAKYNISVEEALKLINDSNKRLVRHYENTNNFWTSYLSDSINPCKCGSNCFHYEYDKNKDTIYGVCNGCNSDIYEVKKSYNELLLSHGNWF